MNQTMEIELLTEFVFESEAIAGISNDKKEIRNHFMNDYGKFKGYVGAIIFLKQIAEDKTHFLTERDVKKVHKLIMEEQAEKWPDLKFDPKAVGKYIDEIFPSDRFIMVDGKILPIRAVTGKMKTLISTINEWQKLRQFGYFYNLARMADFHFQFGLIRPFIDGNGRVGRAVNLYLTLFKDKIPFVFSNNENAYLYYLAFFRRDENLMRQYFFERAGLK